MSTHGWCAKEIAELVGWTCIVLAVVLIFPTVGSADNSGHEPGSSTIRNLVFRSDFGLAILILGSAGVITVLASQLLPERR